MNNPYLDEKKDDIEIGEDLKVVNDKFVEVNKTDSVTSNSTSSTLENRMARPFQVSRELTETSRMFDRHNKGFLDETERAMRQLDDNNKGYLDNHTVYEIMRAFQTEQSKSSELIDALRNEHKKAMNLKKTVIALAAFAILLALSNVGTSFAAAKLAKDSKVSMDELVSLSSGQRLATTSKLVSVEMQPVPAETRRRLQSMAANGSTFGCSGQYSNNLECVLQGQIDYEDMKALYRNFCPGWTEGSTQCLGAGVEKLLFSCNGKVSNFCGGSLRPVGFPSDSRGYVKFPSDTQPYSADTIISTTSNPSCVQPYTIQFYCPVADNQVGNLVGTDKCLGFSTFNRACNADLVLCGPDSYGQPSYY